ncbi:MAG TPA: ROK family protein, partial [Gemmataceae bacterium]
GCLEAYASATAVVARAHEALAQPGSYSSSLAGHIAGPHGGELTAEIVFNEAARGDAVAQRLADETAYYLAVGAVNLMHTIDPDMVVFGGGMTAAGEPFLERIRYYVRQLAFPVPAERTEILFAQLGNDAGFIGAAGCARQLVRKGG